MSSINQNRPYPSTLPNFCNLGIVLRVVLLVDGMSAAAALVQSADPAGAWAVLLDISARVQPVLLLSLAVLCLAGRGLAQLSYRAGVAVVLLLATGLAALVWLVEGVVLGGEAGLPRYGLFALLASSVVLGYLHLRSRALSPALSEARLQALQARIRPHFLFNSINAVLSLIRSEPQRAEQALEDLAGLFRVLMADNRQLVPLRQEVELCRQYLALEQLRLGDRLRVAWHIENLPGEALIPPLVLQPLLENAVYHGIEPSAEAGEIGINIYRARNAVHLVLTNPCPQQGAHHAGRGMALANVRERLELHFDAEASLSAGERNGAYRVHIMLPYSTRRA